MYQTRSCPNCGSSDATREVEGDRHAEALPFEQAQAYWSGVLRQEKVFFSYARCADCGLLFAPTYFTADQLERLYADMAPNMDVVPTGAIEATQRGYFDRAVKKLAPGGDYLEIGPDVGYIVRLAAGSGLFRRFWLYEPNRAVHPELAAATGGAEHLISADMTDLSAVPDGSVSLALIVHVLDHLLDPTAMLEQIRGKLRPDGRLVIVTHNEASLLRRAMGRRWPPFCLQHPQLFDPESISALIRHARYRDVSVERSKNYFPIDYMVRQAGSAARVRLDRLPLPKMPVGLKLGNMITVATP